MKGYAIGAIVLALILASSAGATNLALWTFETSLPLTAGPFTPESGVYNQFPGPSAALGYHVGASTYSHPAGNGSASSFSSNTWAVGDYYQFKSRTFGYAGVTLDWDQTSSNTGPGQFVLQYSTDGTTFTTSGAPYTVLPNVNPPGAWNATTYYSNYHFTVPLTTVTALDNKAAVYFRLTDNSTVSANGTTVVAGGTDRVDNFQIAATADPNATGACCTAGVCTAPVSPASCGTGGGQYMGNNTICTTGLCSTDPTGACCVGTVCALQTQSVCLGASGVWQGAGVPCSPNPCLFDMTIAQAKAYPSGTPVRIAHVIVSSTFDLVNSATYMSFQVQDATGGMTVWGVNADITALLGYIGAGDETTLEGTYSPYNCLGELDAPFNVPPPNYGHPGIPTPIVVHASDFADASSTAEGYESKLVRVNCLTTASTGTWAYGVNYTATDATGSLIIYIANATDTLVGQPIPTTPFDMVGIFSQFDSGGTCTLGYELLPRQLSDETLDPNCIPAGACCIGDQCSITTQVGCSGTWHGLGTDCTPNPCVGACCLNGVCSLVLQAACTTPSIFLGNGSECLVAVCPTPTLGGDLALGLNDGRAWVTAQQIRNDGTGQGVQVGSYSAEEFLQSMEFDNLTGVQHYAHGNLLAVDFGAGGGGVGAPPACTDANRPEEGAKIFSLATNGSNGGQLLWDFNSRVGNPNPHSTQCTRGGGLSVSPNNQYIAFWGTDTRNLYVLRYHAGSGGGSGGSISNEYIYAGLSATAGTGTIGTTWYDDDTILVLCTSTVMRASLLYSVDFDGTNFSNLVLRQTLYHGVAGTGGTPSLFTDIDYNPTVSPYVFCMYSNLYLSISYTNIDVVDPTTGWGIVKQIALGANYLDPNNPTFASCNTGREIALGPDHYLYMGQYAGSGVPRPYVDRLDADNVAGWVDYSSVNYYVMSANPVYAAYNGLDVAFGAPGACCAGTNCVGEFYEQYCIAHYAGTFKGEGVLCSSNPCAPTGACCTPAGACSITTQANCLSPNVWHGEWTSCTPNNCPPPAQTGACCSTTGVCSVITQAACTAAGGHYYGNGTACRTGGGCPKTCKGDMNCDGRVTFVDIDLFVAALAGESHWTHWPCPWINADCNNTNSVNFTDIDPFVAVIGTTCLP
jgi:hypothetical protein